MDIFMLRQNRHKDIFDNVVVELKHPAVLIGEKELSQLKSYMGVIQKTHIILKEYDKNFLA